MAEALPVRYSSRRGCRRTSPARRAGRTGISGSLAAQRVRPDAGGDPGRRFVHGIPHKVGVPRNRLHPEVTRKPAYHRKRFPEVQSARRPGMPQVVKALGLGQCGPVDLSCSQGLAPFDGRMSGLCQLGAPRCCRRRAPDMHSARRDPSWKCSRKRPVLHPARRRPLPPDSGTGRLRLSCRRRTSESSPSGVTRSAGLRIIGAIAAQAGRECAMRRVRAPPGRHGQTGRRPERDHVLGRRDAREAMRSGPRHRVSTRISQVTASPDA